MFTLLITLINISSSSERSAALEAIESSLTQALMNVEIPADIPTLAIGVQIQRYGITIITIVLAGPFIIIVEPYNY